MYNVVLYVTVFISAASMLSYPGRGGGRTLIGYSASGLPLYSGEVSPSNWIKESLHSILINPDSRRIFYFLCLNLVSHTEAVCISSDIVCCPPSYWSAVDQVPVYMYLCVCICVCVFMYLSVFICICVSVCAPTCLFIYIMPLKGWRILTTVYKQNCTGFTFFL